MKSAILFHNKFASDHLVPKIPEGPDRAEFIIKKLEQENLLDQARLVQPVPCSLETLSLNHGRKYIEDFRSSCIQGLDHVAHDPCYEGEVWYDRVACDAFNIEISDSSTLRNVRSSLAVQERMNTPLAADSFELALLAAGSVVQACDLVMKGEVKNAFCIVRPPGHHAEFDMARGFCFFNNIAIGARHLLSKHKLSRVMIVDLDVHHGNGAQHSFYDSDKVLVCNIHHDPSRFYPYNCGYENEIGIGIGKGFNLNIPLRRGSGQDEYNRALSIIESRAKIFNPEFVLLSMGFDAHIQDSMGGMRLNTEYFGYLTSRILEISKNCGGRLVSVLEGGYVRQALADSSAVHFKQLLEV